MSIMPRTRKISQFSFTSAATSWCTAECIDCQDRPRHNDRVNLYAELLGAGDDQTNAREFSNGSLCRLRPPATAPITGASPRGRAIRRAAPPPRQRASMARRCDWRARRLHHDSGLL